MRQDISLVRLYVLRVAYLLVGVGLAAQIWPLILRSAAVPPDAVLLLGETHRDFPTLGEVFYLADFPALRSTRSRWPSAAWSTTPSW